MNENINLTRVLEGCKGMFLYCTVYGDVVFDNIVIGDAYPIKCRVLDSGEEVHFTKGGKLYNSYGECVLFPSRGQRDWSKFEKPIKEGTPIMCCEDMDDLEREYWHYRKYTEREMLGWLYVIPFDKFNPNDIEASLEYNIQK